jgi:hypothetical protein
MMLARWSPALMTLRNYFKSPVQDPFGITIGQEFWCEKILFKYHQKRLGDFLSGGSLIELSEQEALEEQILGKILEVTSSCYWRRRGTKDSHWDEMSIKAIEYLHSLGFTTNKDIAQYIHFRTLPDNVQ